MTDQLPLFETEAEPASRIRSGSSWPPPTPKRATSRPPFRTRPVLRHELVELPRLGGHRLSRTTDRPRPLAREGLREYAQHPLLTDGRDRSQLLRADSGRGSARATRRSCPSGFRCCIKAPAGVTAFTLGPPGGQPERNPDFLSMRSARERSAAAARARVSRSHRAHHPGVPAVRARAATRARGVSRPPRSISRRRCRATSSTPSSCAIDGCSRTEYHGTARARTRRAHLQLLERDADAGRSSERRRRRKTCPSPSCGCC